MARTVAARATAPGSVHEAESLWYETARWQTWVDGLAHIARVEEPWPEADGKVIWDSNPAGRGRVVERVISQEPLRGQTVEVEDDSIRGRQTVSFAPLDEGGVEVALTLAYELKRRSPLMFLIDLLFVRRAMATSLQKTVRRFTIELDAEHHPIP
jgi:hypothetical protein